MGLPQGLDPVSMLTNMATGGLFGGPLGGSVGATIDAGKNLAGKVNWGELGSTVLPSIATGNPLPTALDAWKQISGAFNLDNPHAHPNPHDPKYGQGGITDPARGNPNDPGNPNYVAPGPPAYKAPYVAPPSAPVYGNNTAENTYHDQLLNTYKPNTNYSLNSENDPYKTVAAPGVGPGSANSANTLLQKLK
jgi:hypothetical protein